MEKVTIQTLKENKVIGKSIKKVKIFGDFEVTSKMSVEGIKVTKGAKASIEKAGGSIKE
jgi:large subunit ribosomal protein L15